MGSEIILSNNVTTNAFPTIRAFRRECPWNPTPTASQDPPEGVRRLGLTSTFVARCASRSAALGSTRRDRAEAGSDPGVDSPGNYVGTWTR